MSYRDFARKVQGAKRLLFNSTKKLRNQQRKTFGVHMIPEFQTLRVKTSNMPLVTTPKKYLPAGGIKGH